MPILSTALTPGTRTAHGARPSGFEDRTRHRCGCEGAPPSHRRWSRRLSGDSPGCRREERDPIRDGNSNEDDDSKTTVADAAQPSSPPQGGQNGAPGGSRFCRSHLLAKFRGGSLIRSHEGSGLNGFHRRSAYEWRRPRKFRLPGRAFATRTHLRLFTYTPSNVGGTNVALGRQVQRVGPPESRVLTTALDNAFRLRNNT